MDAVDVRLVEQVVNLKSTLNMNDVSSWSIEFLSEWTLTNTSIFIPENTVLAYKMRTFAPVVTVVPLRTGATTVKIWGLEGVVKVASEKSSILNSHSVLSSPLKRTSFEP